MVVEEYITLSMDAETERTFLFFYVICWTWTIWNTFSAVGNNPSYCTFVQYWILHTLYRVIVFRLIFVFLIFLDTFIGSYLLMTRYLRNNKIVHHPKRVTNNILRVHCLCWRRRKTISTHKNTKTILNIIYPTSVFLFNRIKLIRKSQHLFWFFIFNKFRKSFFNLMQLLTFHPF